MTDATKRFLDRIHGRLNCIYKRTQTVELTSTPTEWSRAQPLGDVFNDPATTRQPNNLTEAEKPKYHIKQPFHREKKKRGHMKHTGIQGTRSTIPLRIRSDIYTITFNTYLSQRNPAH